MPLLVLLGWTIPGIGSAQDCIGDCNNDDVVAINELVTGVNVALGQEDLSACEAFDDGSEDVSVNVLVKAVGNAIGGCGVATPTATPEPTATATVEPSGIFQGALPRTTGRFTYQATVGIDGANAECNTQFPGAHACTVAELQAAESAGELTGATDTGGTEVTSFWAIDPSRPAVDQCTVTVAWDYATAHTGQFADLVNLDNATGALSTLQEDVICVNQHWVGCCL
jgi:hypothetical protein